MTTDPLTFAHAALGCREFADYDTCIEHGGEGWPCRDALRVAAHMFRRALRARARILRDRAQAIREGR